jgi:hypothetical protein
MWSFSLSRHALSKNHKSFHIKMPLYLYLFVESIFFDFLSWLNFKWLNYP